ncbi:MAG: aminotransferase [Henriciella sp.]|jgi:cysteine desulfurase|uniref:cysteine desulfurase family protein n=1 Tax=Henriciella sp. TaxID=1968823 RepID=UPI000C0DC8D7|nr:cysteine desulfurase family protein [Henriciella sp.]MAN75263.1 aminotransferase [Henriciella sp.]MBF33478.1 aminotransferase [Hyphomonadaceae bacterium]PHR79893.1 MAG: aminotransferase [Henriciella sp.]|tara:strand:+ start:16000 stop:17142 length:1143 start_codon:yes stop_codon:yes gene_type:complete
MIYADYNATAPLRPEARDAMIAALEVGANPSSVHGPGRAARKVLETARRQVASAISGIPQDLVFTSGGTEAIALAIHGVVRQLEGNCTLLVSAIEHEAAAQNAGYSGAPVQTVYVSSAGQIDLDDLSNRLNSWDHERHGTPILVLMVANNETGVIQPVSEASAMVREAGGLVICDGVQGLGKISLNVSLLGADYVALSAHKAGGPQGAGALWIRSGAPLRASLFGGGQERSLRSGTENLAGIAGFGAAAEAAVGDLVEFESLAAYRDAMEARLKSEAGVTVFGEEAPRLANTSNFALCDFRAETQVMAMDLAGIAVSSGSACSSGKVKRSLVLSAMGADDALAESAIRTSFGWKSTQQDFELTADAWLKALAQRKAKETA